MRKLLTLFLAGTFGMTAVACSDGASPSTAPTSVDAETKTSQAAARRCHPVTGNWTFTETDDGIPSNAEGTLTGDLEGTTDDRGFLVPRGEKGAVTGTVLHLSGVSVVDLTDSPVGPVRGAEAETAFTLHLTSGAPDPLEGSMTFAEGLEGRLTLDGTATVIGTETLTRSGESIQVPLRRVSVDYRGQVCPE